MKILDTNKTIVAISTPIGVGGIAVVRISGDDAINIADKLFKSNGKMPSKFRNRELVFGDYVGKIAKDKCLCVVFKGPNSFTGENVVEFQCHGGVKLANEIVKDCLSFGAELAENGEFSMRAFVNGKLSLAEAEGMIDLINAQSESELNASYNLMSGGLTKQINAFQDEIVDLISEVEVSFDYPEEDIEYKTKGEIKSQTAKLISQIDELISSASMGSIVKNGINAVIIGKPNVGKSSLLNALINKNKAIVTDIAGTTRDVIEDAFEVNGVKINILDTAGIRETDDIIERLGVIKTKELINQADIVLFVVDSTSPLDYKDMEILALLRDKKYLTIYNKVDLLDEAKLNSKYINVSTKTNKGIVKLKQSIYDAIIDKNIMSNSLLITNNRHLQLLKKARKNLASALKNVDDNTLDLISIDLKESYENLGEITGTTTNEKILDSIFSKFCLGK